MIKSKTLKYFEAERAEGILGTAIGLISVLIGVLFLFGEASLARGASYPLVLFGLLEIAIFLTVAIRTPKDIKRVLEWVESGDSRLKSVEIHRMKKVMRNFKYYRWTEIVLLIIGALILFLTADPFWKGVGVGIVIHSALLLIMDRFAEKRGMAYLNSIKTYKVYEKGKLQPQQGSGNNRRSREVPPANI